MDEYLNKKTDDKIETEKVKRPKIVRILLNLAGTISLGLGILGIVTPLLPTTPFLLLSAACYYRGSYRLHNWLMNHSVFGKYITAYIEKRAISGRMKTKTIFLLWITIGITAVFFVESIIVRIILFVIAILVTIHLVKLNTLNE
ncbi:YbaN family protein [candidate division KSB1 bacterium]